MGNDRGHYGPNGVSRVGQSPQRFSTVYVQRESSSTGAWIIGTIAVGGAFLWARHQSKQIEQLYKTSGMPYQSFAGSLRDQARGIAARVRPTASRNGRPPTTIANKSEG